MRGTSGGFIAFISAIVLSAILLLMAATGSLRGWYARADVLDTEFKLRSEALADACADHALLLLARDALYSGNATTTLSGGTCGIGPLASTAARTTFTVQGEYHAAYTTLKFVVDNRTLEILSREELST